jgi:hypothetical protein
MIIEKIAGLVGHATTVTTEKVYRHELRPVVKGGAVARTRSSSSAPPNLAPRLAPPAIEGPSDLTIGIK